MENREISINNLYFGYDKKQVVNGLSLNIKKGEFVGIIGPNGSGKSTLIKLISGFLKANKGSVSVFGKKINRINRKQAAKLIAVVPQEYPFYFPFKVFDFVMMSRYPYQHITSMINKDEINIVEKALLDTGIDYLKNRSLLELSGGEKQRVVLAAALAQKTEVLLLDEPTSSLDLHFQMEIYQNLNDLNKKDKMTIVAVTHDINLGCLYCDRLILLKEGKVELTGTPEEVVTKENIKKYYDVDVEVLKNKNKNTYIIPMIKD